MGNKYNVSPNKFLVVNGVRKLHPIYERYKGIKQRCYDTNCKNYKYYGARGIKMCDEWLKDYDKFYEWCLSNGWKRELDLDRIDNYKDYSPENCRFVTKKENTRNRRKRVTVEYNGKNYMFWQLEEMSGISRRIIRERIVDIGMTVEQAITIEPNFRRKKHGNKTQYSTLSDIQKG